MSWKDLVEPECGGANPLMRLGHQLTSDLTLRDEGASNFRGINAVAPEVNFATFFFISYKILISFILLPYF